jgi:peptidoglycan/xylan/chitin deacetylase (PgdA/CDA1 family)
VITFHGVGATGRPIGAEERNVWLSSEEFAAALDVAMTIVGVDITFDDGNASDVEIALPELERRGLRGTFFVVAELIDTTGYLSKGQLQELVAAGMTIGSHGMKHVMWRGLSDDDLHAELVESREAIRSLTGHEVTLAACPFGAYDRRVVAAARRAGYRHLFTSDRGHARPGSFIQARSSLHRGGAAEELRAISDETPAERVLQELKRFVKRVR